MAKVQGVKEKLHTPIYDAFFVPGAGLNNNPIEEIQRGDDGPTDDPLFRGCPEQDQAGD